MSTTGQILGGAAGAAAGFMLAGPAGAALGTKITGTTAALLAADAQMMPGNLLSPVDTEEPSSIQGEQL